jgi:hypothetical protein
MVPWAESRYVWVGGPCQVEPVSVMSSLLVTAAVNAAVGQAVVVHAIAYSPVQPAKLAICMHPEQMCCENKHCQLQLLLLCGAVPR